METTTLAWAVPTVVAAVAAALSWWAAERSRAAAREVADRYMPGWRYEHRGVHVLLTNESPETAYDVHVEAPPFWVSGGSAEHAEVTPYSSFMVTLDTDNEAQHDTMLVVSWRRERDPNGKRRAWRAPLAWPEFSAAADYERRRRDPQTP